MRIPLRELAVHAIVIALVTVRLFTERLGILSRWFNPIDLFAVPILFAPCLLWIAQKQQWKIKGRVVVILVAFFCVAWGLAWAANYKEVHWIGGLAFVVGLLWPILFFLIIINLGLGDDWRRRTMWLIEALLLINLIIGVTDAVAGLRSEETGADFVFGTFGANQNQLAFFLAIGLTYRVAQWRFDRLSLYHLITFIAAGALFLLCGFQTLWLMLFASIGAVVLIVGRLSVRTLGIVLALGVTVGLGVSFVTRTGRFFSISTSIIGAIDQFNELGKVELVRNVFQVWQIRPLSLVTGVGPGTFNSRAFRSIAKIPYPGKASDLAKTDVASQLVEPFYVSDLSSRFILPYFERGVFHLSGSNTDGPFTSYVSVPIEVGLPGSFCLFGVYGLTVAGLIRSLRRIAGSREKTFAAWALMNVFMLLGISLVDNYLETTRYTTMVWLSVAIWSVAISRPQVKHPEMS